MFLHGSDEQQIEDPFQTENDAELAQFIELVNDEENEQQSFTVRLGDFDNFSKFLKTIIGHRDEQ